MLLLANKTLDKLKYDLVREGLIDIDTLNNIQKISDKNSTNLATELVNNKIISEQTLLKFIQDKLHIPYVELSDYVPDITSLQYVSKENAQKYNIFPLFKIEDVLTIAMSDPLDLFAINALFEDENITIEPVVCAENSIKDAINKYYFDNNFGFSWQNNLVMNEVSDEIIHQTIADIIKNAIDEKHFQIYFENTPNGMNVYFEKVYKAVIPNILAPGFLFELSHNFANIGNFDETIPRKSKFDFEYKNTVYPVIISFLPTKFGIRIAMEINMPFAEISDEIKNKINIILEKPSMVGIKNYSNDFVYSLANYLSVEHSILMIENIVKYNLDNVAQYETGKNTGLYFDEIINQIEFQKFDIVFFEKIYTKEQFEKLKLLSKERTIFTFAVDEDCGEFDFIINSNGKII